MLNNFGMILSRKTRVALRNSLTRRHPAVPLPQTVVRGLGEEQGGGGQEQSWLDLGDFGEVRGNKLTFFVLKLYNVRNPVNILVVPLAGVKVETYLTKQMQRWQEDLDERIKDHEKPPRYWEFPELEKGNIHPHCSYCFRVDCRRTLDSSDPPDDRGCGVVKCRWECGALMHSCKLLEHKVSTSTYVVPKFLNTIPH